MSILFVLLTYLVIISVNYFWFQTPKGIPIAPRPSVRPPAPVMSKEHGFSIPKDYAFHPGHTWVAREDVEDVRVGMDGFAADMVGKIDRIDVVGATRWVRQGQKLMTLHVDGVSLDLVSPVEGVVMAVNQDVLKDPALALRDPYKDGWIARLKSPDYKTNEKNLMQKSMVAPWMHYTQTRLSTELAAANPALAQDGGVPVNGLLQRVQPELRQKLITDFFLN